LAGAAFIVDPFLDNFFKLLIMFAGAAVLAAALWRWNYQRRKRKRMEEWMREAKGEVT
jgi:membrane protein implicated in regulation of membrane protease activity